MKLITPIRPSPIAGSWYSADPTKLSNEIDGFIDRADPPELSGPVIGLVAPHAGYFYSGETAGYAYRCVKGFNYDLCIIVSPLHDYQPYDLMTSAHSAYSTPLGEVEVASRQVSAVNRLLALSKGSKIEPIAYDREHSLEIQLPFLQTALVKPFQLLPIMVRTNDPVILKDTAEALAEVVENEISQSKKVLLIASTDLSHFYSEVEAKRYDDYMLAKMASFTPEGVLEAELSRKGFACGAGAVALVLWTTQFLGANKVTILNYSTSARASGDRSSVVGYGAAAITRQG